MQKLTTLDFPGVVSALIFSQGCNFHCPYCHNAQLIPTAPSQTAISGEDVLAFLEKRAGLLDGVVVTGGEPCLQPGLESFCRKAKSLGYKVKLDTNGSFPDTVARLLAANCIDYAAVDVKTAPENYAPALTADEAAGENLVRTLGLLAASSVPYETRTTCVFPYVDENAVRALAAVLRPDAPWYFQRANIESASSSIRALTDGEIRRLVAAVQPTHPLARLRE